MDKYRTPWDNSPRHPCIALPPHHSAWSLPSPPWWAPPTHWTGRPLPHILRASPASWIVFSFAVCTQLHLWFSQTWCDSVWPPVLSTSRLYMPPKTLPCTDIVLLRTVQAYCLLFPLSAHHTLSLHSPAPVASAFPVHRPRYKASQTLLHPLLSLYPGSSNICLPPNIWGPFPAVRAVRAFALSCIQ